MDKLEHTDQHEAEPGPGIRKLLQLLSTRSNRTSAISAALRAVESTPPPTARGAEADLAKQALAAEAAAQEQKQHAQQVAPANLNAMSFATAIAAADGPAFLQPSLAQPANKQQMGKEISTETSVMGLQQNLKGYPKCSHLMETFKKEKKANMQNKTPLALLYEYATRLNLEVLPSSKSQNICTAKRQSNEEAMYAPGLSVQGIG